MTHPGLWTTTMRNVQQGIAPTDFNHVCTLTLEIGPWVKIMALESGITIEANYYPD